MKPWYEALFDNYARRYDQEVFTQGTIGECDFIEKEIAADKSARILDIGCGTGRHAIELAQRGYHVTGVDLSASQLARAKEKAREQRVQVDFRQGDARGLGFQAAFDLAIMLCEGAFPLMETDAMNFEILRNAHAALKHGGKFIFTTLNGLFPLFHSVKDFLSSHSREGCATYHGHAFDLMTFRDKSVIVIEDDAGRQKELTCNERYYVPSEIIWLLSSLGFERIAIHGAKLGAYSRQDPLTPEDYEMLVIAEKPSK